MNDIAFNPKEFFNEKFNKPNEIKSLHNIIDKFKNRATVVNGIDIGWKNSADKAPTISNRPISVGDGLNTTGWCVSASEAFLKDAGFESFLQIYGGFAKLVSIDIKEQYHGYCYNGSQNKWHTAILLTLSNEETNIKTNYIIDLTCGQFGNEYVNKNVWNVESWMNKFRSPLCQHNIIDNFNKPLTVIPTSNREFSDNELMLAKYNLKDFTLIDESEREMLMKFLVDFSKINNRLILGLATKKELDFLNKIIELYIDKLNVEYKIPSCYTSLMFENKESAINWIETILNLREFDVKSGDLVDFVTKQNFMVFETLDKSKEFFDIPTNFDDKYLLNIEFKNITGFKGFTGFKNKSFLNFVGSNMWLEFGKDIIRKISKNEAIITFNGEK